jgi:hypothetical protein
MNKNDDKYDIIIDINSIRKLNEGWQIQYNGNEDEKIELEKMIKSDNKRFISILGHSNRGKTYILQKISGEKLIPGYEITTKGISIKRFGKSSFLLDTVGTNAPLLVDDPKKDPRDDVDFSNKVNDINLCQIITNYIVQTFVIQNADILICVVGMLTSSEQQFLNKIKKNCSGKKRLIVIHNLIHCYDKNEVEDYINNILKKSIIHEFKEISIVGFENRSEFFDKFYIEKGNGMGREFEIKHFIMANDTNKNDKNIRYFNMPTIKYIRDELDLAVKKNVDLLTKLKEHIEIISNQVLVNGIKNISIEKSNNGTNDLIICNDMIQPKDVNADELDNIYFVGKEYVPPHRYYIKDDKFTIEIKICSKINFDTLIVKKTWNKEFGEFKIEISGERILEDKEDLNGGILIHELINKRTWKNFKLEFKIRIKDYKIQGLGACLKSDRILRFGILYLYFKVLR